MSACGVRIPIATVALALSMGIAGCATDDVPDADATPENSPDANATPENSTDVPPTTREPVESAFYCGDFGDEQPSTLLAVDVETGTPVWKSCMESTMPLSMFGRADGATVLLSQDGRGGAELIAIDDTGEERWRRPTGAMNPEFVVAGSTAVVTTDEVEGILASTGEVRWRHPVAEGTPIGATDDLVIEALGGPYALSSDLSDLSRTGPVTMRAVDSASGEQRWSHLVDMVDTPLLSQYRVTVGDDVIVIPDTDGSAVILATDTGAELRSESGLVEADGAVLYERDPRTYQIAALIDPISGTRIEPPTGSPVVTMTYSGQASSGLLLASDPPTGPAATLALVDTQSGDVRWTIPYVQVIGGSDDLVIVADGPVMRVIDAGTGSVISEYQAPTDLATFGSGVAGDGIVIVAPQWRGGEGGGDPGTEQYVQPDCEGGPTIFDADVGGSRIVVSESVDATVFCVDQGAEIAVGYIPTLPTPDPVEDSVMTAGHGVFHIVALPKGFPPMTGAIDSNGSETTIARGVGADYLLLIQEATGGQTEGAVYQMSSPGFRRMELLGDGGSVLARVPVSDVMMGMSDPSSNGGAPTFEDIAACASEHGVDIPLTQAGQEPVVAEPSSPEALRDAWESCHDLMAGWIGDPLQGATPEFTENHMARLDCVADAGFYPSLGQAPTNESNAAYETCGETTPGRGVLVECLTAGGLAVTNGADVTGGPHPTDLATEAWAGCRDLYITWFVPNQIEIDARVDPLDCAAQKGWIPAIMDLHERLDPVASADIAACRESN